MKYTLGLVNERIEKLRAAVQDAKDEVVNAQAHLDEAKARQQEVTDVLDGLVAERNVLQTGSHDQAAVGTPKKAGGK